MEDMAEPDAAGAPTFSVERYGARATVKPIGELDVAVAGEFRALLNSLATEERDVTVDLVRTTFVDSTILGVLLGAVRRFNAASHSLVLRSPQPPIERVLDLTGLIDVIPVEWSAGHRLR
jgi:anti-anti-sigma factor